MNDLVTIRRPSDGATATMTRKAAAVCHPEWEIMDGPADAPTSTPAAELPVELVRVSQGVAAPRGTRKPPKSGLERA